MVLVAVLAVRVGIRQPGETGVLTVRTDPRAGLRLVVAVVEVTQMAPLADKAGALDFLARGRMALAEPKTTQQVTLETLAAGAPEPHTAAGVAVTTHYHKHQAPAASESFGVRGARTLPHAPQMSNFSTGVKHAN